MSILKKFIFKQQKELKHIKNVAKDPRLSRKESWKAQEEIQQRQKKLEVFSTLDRYMDSPQVHKGVTLYQGDPLSKLLQEVQDKGKELYISCYEAHYQLDNFIYIFKAVDKNDHEIRISEVITKEVK